MNKIVRPGKRRARIVRITHPSRTARPVKHLGRIEQTVPPSRVGSSRSARTDRTEENRATTGQGVSGTRANVSVNLTPEKRTRIHEVIVQASPRPSLRRGPPHWVTNMAAALVSCYLRVRS